MDPTLPSLQPLRAALRGHSLYGLLTTEARLRAFMRTHAFCVWDFQSLLKELQRRLTRVEVPWVPVGDPHSRRLINEIVLEEESDCDEDSGRCFSHVELYLEAMDACGADASPVLGLIEAIRGGQALDEALTAPTVPEAAREFVRSTFEVIETGPTHAVAAAFAHGREDVIPVMFSRFVEELAGRAPERWLPFLYYLERHVERDGDRHGPAALELAARACGDDAGKWSEAEAAASQALEARRRLWDRLAAELAALA